MGSGEGATTAMLHAVVTPGPPDDDLFDARQVAALRYADAMTTDDVSDELFAELRSQFDDDEIVELTGVIAWENSSARFNRALRVESMGLWNEGDA